MQTTGNERAATSTLRTNVALGYQVMRRLGGGYTANSANTTRRPHLTAPMPPPHTLLSPSLLPNVTSQQLLSKQIHKKNIYII